MNLLNEYPCALLSRPVGSYLRHCRSSLPVFAILIASILSPTLLETELAAGGVVLIVA